MKTKIIMRRGSEERNVEEHVHPRDVQRLCKHLDAKSRVSYHPTLVRKAVISLGGQETESKMTNVDQNIILIEHVRRTFLQTRTAVCSTSDVQGERRGVACLLAAGK